MAASEEDSAGGSVMVGCSGESEEDRMGKEVDMDVSETKSPKESVMADCSGKLEVDRVSLEWPASAGIVVDNQTKNEC